MRRRKPKKETDWVAFFKNYNAERRNLLSRRSVAFRKLLKVPAKERIANWRAMMSVMDTLDRHGLSISPFAVSLCELMNQWWFTMTEREQHKAWSDPA